MRGVLRSRDTDLMLGALAALGVDIEPGETPTVTLTLPAARRRRVLRSRRHGHAIPAAGRRVRRRTGPLRRRRAGTIPAAVDDPRRIAGAGVDVDGDALPFTVNGTGRAAGGAVTIDASASSQFVSGLLLSAPRFDDGVTVHHVGKPVPSTPHIDMTVDMLRTAGVAVDTSEANTWRVAPGRSRPSTGLSNPTVQCRSVLAAAAATGGTVTVPYWPAVTTQPGAQITDVLRDMGW